MKKANREEESFDQVVTYSHPPHTFVYIHRLVVHIEHADDVHKYNYECDDDRNNNDARYHNEIVSIVAWNKRTNK